MKDARGHGSIVKGGGPAGVHSYMVSHQTGVNSVPSVAEGQNLWASLSSHAIASNPEYHSGFYDSFRGFTK